MYGVGTANLLLLPIAVLAAGLGFWELVVRVNDMAAASMATQHLIELGRRRIAAIGTETDAKPDPPAASIAASCSSSWAKPASTS